MSETEWQKVEEGPGYYEYRRTIEVEVTRAEFGNVDNYVLHLGDERLLLTQVVDRQGFRLDSSDGVLDIEKNEAGERTACTVRLGAWGYHDLDGDGRFELITGPSAYQGQIIIGSSLIDVHTGKNRPDIVHSVDKKTTYIYRNGKWEAKDFDDWLRETQAHLIP